MGYRRGIVPLLLVVAPLLSSLGMASHPLLSQDANPPVAKGARASGTPSPVPGIYRVYYEGQDQLAELALHFDIWEVSPRAGYAVLVLSAEDAVRLAEQGHWLEPAAEQTQKWILGPPDYPCYRNVDELYAAQHQMTTSYPHLAEFADYGDSWQKVQGLSGYDLRVLKVTNTQVQAPKPRFFLMANIHARELTTPETAMYFIEYLLDNYGTDPDATWILDYHEIYVVVTANPDGRQWVEQNCGEWHNYQRKNRNDTQGTCTLCDPFGTDQYGVDLNRNNPFRWGGAGTTPCGLTYQGTSAASEPETYYLNDLVRSIIPDQRPNDDLTAAADGTTGLLISLHSYGNLVLWPWGWTSRSAPNSARLQTLGHKFAYLNTYRPEQSSDLYPTTGDTTDWAYGELGIPAYTFELGEFFFQSCDDLQQIMEDNLGALLYAAKVPRTPYVTPAGPDALDLSVLPVAVAPGNSVRLTAIIDDSRYNNTNGSELVQPIAAAAYYIDTPPWITTTTPITHELTAADGSYDEIVEEVQATVDTSGLSNGRHIIFVRGQDADGHWGAFSAVFLHVAEPPTFQTYLPIIF